MLKLNQRNKGVFFSIIFLLTIIITRILLYIKPFGITILGVRLHHFEYGIVILAIMFMIKLFKKISAKTLMLVSGISLGLIMDEFFFVIKGMKDVQQYYSTLLPTLILAIILGVIIILNSRSIKRI